MLNLIFNQYSSNINRKRKIINIKTQLPPHHLRELVPPQELGVGSSCGGNMFSMLSISNYLKYGKLNDAIQGW